MRLVLAAVGRMKAGPERELLDRYVSRSRGLLRHAGISSLDTWAFEESRAGSPNARKREEGSALLGKLDRADALVVCDERGQAMTSVGFASALVRARDDGTTTFAFAVGGPDGFDPDTRARASLIMSFGAATLPHQLVRVLVAEQIYRALTILTGHPYHRG